MLEASPKIGVDFFTGKLGASANLTSEQMAERMQLIQEAMSHDETLAFLEDCSANNKATGRKDTTTQEKYLEYLTAEQAQSTPDNLYTKLAEMYIQKLLSFRSANAPNCKADFLDSYQAYRKTF